MRYSPQRELILNILKSSYNHPMAEVILNHANEKFPNLGLGSVYRNLKQLKDSNKISSHIFSGSHHYDGNMDPRHHFYCKDCETIIENPIITEDLIKKLQISVEGMDLSLTGLCSDCKQKTGEKP